jgi:DNA repair protein RadA/Sms
MQEERFSAGSKEFKRPSLANQREPFPLVEADVVGEERHSTGIPEFDRVLGGGAVRGSVILIGGEPGIGKSTLLLQACSHLARSGKRVLLVSGEESPVQIQMRARRLSALSENLYLFCETDLSSIEESAERIQPQVLVVDSIQTLFSPDIPSLPGGLSQVRECALRLQLLAKARGLTTFLVGHVTKDGSLAGPRVLEHMVDTVLYFEGERFDSLRVLRAAKNRFGSVSEVGVFEMGEHGLEEVSDPSLLFARMRSEGVSGVAPVITMEGKRPLLVEVQALVTPTNLPVPKRVASGLEYQRFILDLAVLEKRTGLRFGDRDVFLGVAGGLHICEPAIDLGICLAIASSRTDLALPAKWAFFGEVSLAGEVRPVSHMEARVREAERLGFTGAVLPIMGEVNRVGKEFKLVRVGSLAEALQACSLKGR